METAGLVLSALQVLSGVAAELIGVLAVHLLVRAVVTVDHTSAAARVMREAALVAIQELADRVKLVLVLLRVTPVQAAVAVAAALIFFPLVHLALAAVLLYLAKALMVLVALLAHRKAKGVLEVEMVLMALAVCMAAARVLVLVPFNRVAKEVFV